MNTRPRFPLLLAAMALVATVTAGCFPQAPTPQAPAACTPADRALDAYEFGDSLSAWAAHGSPGHFDGTCDQFTNYTGAGLSLNAMGGTRVDHWFPTFPNVKAGTCVLIFLGTNDLTNLTLEAAKWNALEALNMVRDAGARRVVWGLLDENSAAHRPAPALAETRGYNAFLRQLVADGTYGDLLHLADWNAVASDPAKLGGQDAFLLGNQKNPADWVHHTDDGAGQYALFIRLTYQEQCL